MKEEKPTKSCQRKPLLKSSQQNNSRKLFYWRADSLRNCFVKLMKVKVLLYSENYSLFWFSECLGNLGCISQGTGFRACMNEAKALVAFSLDLVELVRRKRRGPDLACVSRINSAIQLLSWIKDILKHIRPQKVYHPHSFKEFSKNYCMILL